jgi:hypothetical protein
MLIDETPPVTLADASLLTCFYVEAVPVWACGKPVAAHAA